MTEPKSTEPRPGGSTSRPSPGDLAAPEFIASLLIDGDDDLAAWALGQAIDERSRASVFDGILRTAMELVGTRWSAGDWSISQEHLASVALRHVLARLRPPDGAGARIGPVAVLAAPAGEHHVAGLACLAQVLEERGWHVEDLGPDVPADDLAGFLADREVDLVCLSIGLSDHLAALAATVAAVRRAAGPRDIAVIVGGRGTTGLDHLEGADFIAASLEDVESFIAGIAPRAALRTEDEPAPPG
jgi:methanogenic corrinoid protein MtbC1